MLYKLLLALEYYLVYHAGYAFGENTGEKVIHYNADTFPAKINVNNHFIMFYAPWCGYCKKLHPTWEKLAEMLNDDPRNEVVIGKVDCTVDNSLCIEHDVTGYPTLKFFKIGNSEGIKFRGTRDLPSLISFLNEQLNKLPTEGIIASPVITNGLTELTDSSFDNYVKNGNFFIKFYAPWCGYCQKLAPIWEDFAKSLEGDLNVVVGKLDCTVHKTVCNKLEIKGYPTLLWIKDGKVIEKYQGSRSESDFKSYVNKMLGTKEANSDNEFEESGGMIILNSENFNSGISEGLSFVKFFAPWCGHCKRLAPIWNELNQKVKQLPDVRLVKVDCTQENSKELCNEQEVEGFPTLFLYKNGKKIAEYNGSRNLEEMFEFLSKHLPRDEL